MNINNNNIAVLGHGGMGIASTYPLNSFESILNCLNHGADGTEIDVQMTKDSVLVAFHDKTLERATKNHSGHIYEKNWQELKDAKYKKPLYATYQVITLEELFSNIENPKDYIFFLDCKNFNPDNSSAYLHTFNNALIRLINKFDLAEHIFIEFKRESLIESMQQKRPDLKMFAYIDFEIALDLADEYPLQGITISVDKITKEEVVRAHDKGLMIAVFNTYSHKRNKDAIKKNVDFIQSDKVKHLIKLLK